MLSCYCKECFWNEGENCLKDYISVNNECKCSDSELKNKYNITEENKGLIKELLYLEDCIDNGEVKAPSGEDFYNKFFPYTIQETIGILVDHDLSSTEKYSEFKKYFNEVK